MFRCKPRVGSCVTSDETTYVTWAVVGEIDGYSPTVLEEHISTFLGDGVTCTIEVVSDPTECEAGELNYSGECSKCPANTYQPDISSTSCKSCPDQSITFYEGAKCSAQCHSTYGSDSEDIHFSSEVELDACVLWKVVDAVGDLSACSSSGTLADDLCDFVLGFTEASEAGLITEQFLYQSLGSYSDICDSGICSFISKISAYHSCDEGDDGLIKESIEGIAVPIPHILIQHIEPYGDIVQELYSMGYWSEIKYVLESVRYAVIPILQEFSSNPLVKDNLQTILSSLGQNEIANFIYMNMESVPEILDYVFQTLDTIELYDPSLTFEDSGNILYFILV